MTDWPTRLYNHLFDTAEKLMEAVDSSNDFVNLIHYYYAASGEKTLSLPIFLYNRQMPKSISVSNFKVEEHTCGRLKEIVQNCIQYGIEFLSSDGVGDIINNLCGMYGLPQVGEWIENGATIISNFELLEGFLEGEPHNYYTYSAMVEYTYEGGELIRVFYSFNDTDNPVCEHYDGIHANINVYTGLTLEQFYMDF